MAINDRDQVSDVECGSPGEDGYHPELLLTEVFGPLLALVELEGGNTDDYLSKAVVPFLNNKDNIFGSLVCSIYTPASKGNAHDRPSLQSALKNLQYGSICVNAATVLGYVAAMNGGVWGGNQLERRGESGNGHIGDA